MMKIPILQSDLTALRKGFNSLCGVLFYVKKELTVNIADDYTDYKCCKGRLSSRYILTEIPPSDYSKSVTSYNVNVVREVTSYYIEFEDTDGMQYIKHTTDSDGNAVFLNTAKKLADADNNELHGRTVNDKFRSMVEMWMPE